MYIFTLDKYIFNYLLPLRSPTTMRWSASVFFDKFHFFGFFDKAGVFVEGLCSPTDLWTQVHIGRLHLSWVLFSSSHGLRVTEDSIRNSCDVYIFCLKMQKSVLFSPLSRWITVGSRSTFGFRKQKLFHQKPPQLHLVLWYYQGTKRKNIFSDGKNPPQDISTELRRVLIIEHFWGLS